MKQIALRYRPVIIGLVMLALLTVSLFFYTKTLKDNFQNEIILTLEEVSLQGQYVLQGEINGKLELLFEVSRRIGFYGIDEYEKAVEVLADTCEENHFKRMGIITADGITYTTDHVQMDLTDRAYYKRGMAGESSISEPLVDREGSGGINVYAVPVRHEGRITAVLFGTYDTDEMRRQMETPSFGGQGYTYIVDKTGECVVGSVSANSYPDMKNIFLDMAVVDGKNEASIDRMKSDIREGSEGCVKFNNEDARYMYYRPIHINDWYLLTVAPANVLDSKMNAVLGKTYLLGGFLFLIFGGVFLYALREQKQRKTELMNILYTDEITGGYSFAKFQTEAMKKIDKSEPGQLALISLDIDDFKIINELLGYQEGNHLIRYVHEVLSEWCESGEIYAHQTADMFVALIYDHGKQEVCERLEELYCRLQSYSVKPQNKLAIVPAIGVFQIRDRQHSLDFCLDCAGIARKSRKGQFAVHYSFYDEKVKEKIYHDKQIEAEMKPALENGEFRAYYQPQYDAETKQIVGAEALVRWIHPDGKVIPPDSFIPLFEKNGFISELDRYMFRSVCEQQKEWREQGRQVVPISVNISRKLLYDLNFMETYNTILADTGISVRDVEVEITESVFFDNQPRLIKVIGKLHQSGYKILLDDFGTGYSSMSMLKDLPFDILKIDKSFVDTIGDERGNKIVDGIIRLADSLGLKTIAEGVETEAQYEYLKIHGCDVIQGYYFGRPLTKEAFEKLIGGGEQY